MIYGTPSLHIDDDQTDRCGFRTLILSLLWQPSRWPMSLDEYDGETPVAPASPRFMEYLGKQTVHSGGALRTKWTYEGVATDGKGPAFRGRGKSIDFQFDPGFSQIDIAQHPKLQQFMAEFGLTFVDGEPVAPPTISSSNAGLGLRGALANPNDQGQTNPIFGRKDFLSVEGSYTYRYAALDLSGVARDEGTIHTSAGLPGRAPFYEGRDWLKAPTQYRFRGFAFDVTEIYLLSQPGGWPKVMYGRASQR